MNTKTSTETLDLFGRPTIYRNQPLDDDLSRYEGKNGFEILAEGYRLASGGMEVSEQS